jgi:protein TilB
MYSEMAAEKEQKERSKNP